MWLRIEKLKHRRDAVRQRIYDFLAPHETHALFILGNLNADFPGSHLYVMRRGREWLGLAGYYEGPRSLIPFSRDPDITRKLVRHIARRHRDIGWMNGIGYSAGPAYETLLDMGYVPVWDPKQVFMELDSEPPPQPHEERVRLMRESDRVQVARFMRYVRRHPDPEGELGDEEIRGIGLNRLRYVLDVGGQAVSTACTNGIGIKAFQVIGVATAPEHRRRGYARAVCAALIRAMYERSATKCVIFTNHDNLAAIRCYEGLGFRVTDDYIVARFKSRGR